MSYLMAALVAAGLSTIPLLAGRKFVLAGVVGVLGFFVLFAIFYFLQLGFMAPYLGGMVFCGVALFTVSTSLGLIDSDRSKADSRNGLFLAVPIIYGFICLLTAIMGAKIFHASEYASMLGTTDTKVWTRDVQPKDEHHVRLMSTPTALYLAHKSLGVLGTVGSQFQVADDLLTLQRVNNQLVYVVPLDFVSFGTWSTMKTSPGYIVIDAQNPDSQPVVVQLPEAQRLKYTPGAGFDENLFRYLRHKGFVNVGFAEANFELDEQRHPYWIVPLYERQIFWGAPKITGVAIVDPASGDVQVYAPDKVPTWVDRVIPQDFIQNYLNWHGRYAQGSVNNLWMRNSITKAEEPKLVYSSENTADWATGMTSDRGARHGNNAHDTLLAIAYTNSRSGHTTFYTVDGGATDSAIEDAVNANQDVSYKHLHAEAPQIYNLYGDMVAVVPLFNNADAYQAVAFASVKNPQEVAVGQDVFEAGRNYQSIMSRRNGQALPANSTTLSSIQGVIDRIRQDVGSNGSPYYFHLAGQPRIFTAFSRDYAKLPLTMPGDHVSVTYIKSGETTVPVRAFDNESLPLDQTSTQAQAEAKITAGQVANDNRKAGSDFRRKLSGMSDEEIAKALQK
jgi:hypothetical protein